MKHSAGTALAKTRNLFQGLCWCVVKKRDERCLARVLQVLFRGRVEYFLALLYNMQVMFSC